MLALIQLRFNNDVRNGCISRLVHKSHDVKNALLNKGSARRSLVLGQDAPDRHTDRQRAMCVLRRVQLATPRTVAPPALQLPLLSGCLPAVGNMRPAAF